MTTLLQNLLLRTLQKDANDSVLKQYIEKLLPAIEKEFALIPALGGLDKNQNFAKKADQSLLVHVLNGLIIAWNLSKELDEQLEEIEEYLLCLGFTLHDYNKYFYHHQEKSPEAHQTIEIIERCQELGKLLEFSLFLEQWQEYIADICYLAQNTQKKNETNSIPSNWEKNGYELQLDIIELDKLTELLAFGDLAVHVENPSDIITKTIGDRLDTCLYNLGIDKRLTYHRLRDCRGLITNKIHNAILEFTAAKEWQPVIYFAQGTIYLAPEDSQSQLNLPEILEAVWKNILQGNRGLESAFRFGDVGFIRDGKGIKIAPLTRELFSPAELIRLLPNVIIAKVANIKEPATPKRLAKLDLSNTEEEYLLAGADVWSDRIAEFIILTQREFFKDSEEFNSWILTALNLKQKISVEETKAQKGGVNYGWYRVTANYIAVNKFDRHPGSEELTNFLRDLGNKLATWAEENNLLGQHDNLTKNNFGDYLTQYLEISDFAENNFTFTQELANYVESKNNNQAICSLSSGEYLTEEQVESVVLFQPQIYSNKNRLGSGKIKRYISKIWSLEMILRQTYWSVGNLEDKRAIFLYTYPAYVYSPQVAKAVKILVNQLKKVNLWEVRKIWQQNNLQIQNLSDLLLEAKQPKPNKKGDIYSDKDLPFLAVNYTEISNSKKAKKATITETWIEPTFLALILAKFLGVKVVATPSSHPIYQSDREFIESVKLEGIASFWYSFGFHTSLRLQELEPALEKLLIAYSIHLDTRSSPPDARWQAFNSTVQEITSDVLHIFSLAFEGLRRDNRDNLSVEEISRYITYAEKWSQGDLLMTKKLSVTKKITEQYYQFYRVGVNESSHSILLPFVKALEEILAVPDYFDDEELILQGTGEIQRALDRQKIFKRPLMTDKTIEYTTRQKQEQTAIENFMTTCVKELFGKMCKGDRALLQQYQNRFKSGVIIYYQKLARDNQ